MRGLILLLNFLLLMGLMQSCFEPEGEVEELSFQKVGDGMDPADAFAATLHPLLVGKCASCHGDSGTQVKHALSDAKDAYDVVNSRSLISLENPAGSNIVAKVRSGHNCWTNCQANGDELQTAVENMKNLVATQGGKIFDRAASTEVFKVTVHPLLVGKCAGCHGDPGQQAPRHAVTDARSAHDAVIDSARVDFGNIPKSRLVLRLKEDQHYCWGDCEDNANEMQGLIEQWAAQIDTSPLTGVDGIKTTSLSISDAQIRLPETINGTVMLQAEDAILEGRYNVKADADASGLKYVSGDLPPVHPIEGTNRTVTFRGPNNSTNGSQLCRTVTPDQVSGGQDGRFQLSETRRHPDQTKYRYYSQEARGRIIRPQLRAQYLQALINGETDLQRFYLTFGIPDDPANPNGPLTGNPINRDFYRYLPEFASISLYNNSIKDAAAGSEYEDFFAPRFGASGTEFFSASNSELRANVPDGVRRRNAYDQVYDIFRDMFYNNNNLTQPNGAYGDVPFTLRTMPDGTQYVTNNQASSDAFMAWVMGDLTIANAATVVGTDPNGNPIKKIDTYFHFYQNDAGRAFNDVTVNTRNADGSNGTAYTYDLDRGTVELDLNNFFSGGDALDERTITINNYGAIVKPIFVANCASCHGDGSGRPQFAANNDTVAYDAGAAVNGFINFSNPAQARPMVRMFQERHNCGSNAACDTIGNALVAAYTQWNNENLADIAASQNSQDTGLIALSEQDKTPGRAKFAFRVTEAGDYNVWLKVKTLVDGSNAFRVRILDSQGRPVKNCAQTQSCVPSESDYTGGAAQIDAIGCQDMQPGTRSVWTWWTQSIDNANNRRKWMLGEGDYTLEVIETEPDAKFDLVAVSKNPAFNPRDNLIDEAVISSKSPKILVYDLQDQMGAPATFEIEVKEQGGGDAYLFRNPRFRGAAQNIMFRDIKLLMNNSYKFENSTFTKLDRIVNGQDSGVLTNSSLLALQVFGANTDSFAFVFKALSFTNEPPQAIEDDAPVPVEGRECQNLELFEKTVMPILNNFRLIMKDDYEEYTSDDFPGRGGQGVANPTLYNCTTCHNEDHPYFKMTTFVDGLEPGQPIPQEGLATLCRQALSRVDFGNYEQSLLLRGLNGTFNHPKLHFVQSVGFTGTGDNRRFITSVNDPSGYHSEFIGLRFEKWTKADLGISSVNCATQTNASCQYVGRYKRINYTTYNNPFNIFDGVIRTTNDQYDGNGEMTAQGNGRNLYSTRAASDQNGPYKVKDNCVEVDFNSSGGIVTDPCNNNVNVETEFEQLKQTYRDSVINWMNEEKKSYDALYGN